jgi:hypothetical protein
MAEICERLKAGAFDHVAVESLGVPLAVYEQWLKRGQAKGARGLCRQLANGVMQARAHARFMSEMALRGKDAKTWLLSGPGRETPSRPGWTSAGKPAAGAQVEEPPLRLLELCAELLQALAPFPEARIAAAEAVERALAAGPGNKAGKDTPGRLCHS